MLLVFGIASAQNAADTAPIEPIAAPDAAAPSTTATGGAAPAAAAAGGSLGGLGTIGLNLGPAFYGPGLNNANAIPPNPQIIQLMQNYLKSAPNAANLRVFVGVDGAAHFTNQFGQETEVLHPQFGDLNEVFQDPIEVQERMTEFRQQELDRAIARCQTDLRQRFFNDPGSFTPNIFAGLNTAAAGVGAGARAVVA